MVTPPGFLKSQFTTLPYPTSKFTGQTIIVTGSNVGIGLEAARHFVRLEAAKVILAVRSISKGETAKTSIESSTKRLGVVEVWELDLASYGSVKAFAEKVRGLERLDVVIGNAGMFTWTWELVEGDEKTITVNVVSTFLLSLLLLPKLRETAVKTGKASVLSLTGSFTHFMTTFPERENPNIFEELRREDAARMDDRYQVSKMIELLCLRELADQLTQSTKEGHIIASLINPGYVATEIMREATFINRVKFWFLRNIMARTPEVGGRTLIHAAEGGDDTHGAYLNDCKPAEPSEFVRSEEGKKIQKQLWKELGEKLERVRPGIMQNL